jgi:TrpR family trp operon transcriptional repressor
MCRPIADIARILTRARDPRLAEGFLRQLLTPEELKDIGLRWSLVRLLHQGASQRDIARRLGVSLCKITRGSRELKRKDGAFRRVLGAEEEDHG